MSQKIWSGAGLFMVFLVLMLPINSASGLAAIQITANSGTAGINEFIDANGDTWTVDAELTSVVDPFTNLPVTEINPADVKLVVGTREFDFKSCLAGVEGHVCTYTAEYDRGVNSGKYSFQVQYPNQIAASGTLRADGSAPTVSFVSSPKQEGEGVRLEFSVEDPARGDEPCVGLDSVQILNDDDESALDSLNDFDGCSMSFNDVVLGISGSGRKHVKVVATDKLGHSQTSVVKSVDVDFIKPIIQSSSINFTSLGKFSGQNVQITDITIRVLEANIKEVKAFSDTGTVELNGQAAECDIEDDLPADTSVCVWRVIQVAPSDSHALRIVAEDFVGNTAETTATKSFTVDPSGPVIEFLGTQRVFEDNSYVSGKSGVDKKIILRALESGAGMDKSGVVAKLGALGGERGPDECEQTTSTFNCVWNIGTRTVAGDTARVTLTRFQDKVGNVDVSGSKEQSMIVDSTAPLVEVIELSAVGDAGEKEFFQTGDTLNVKMRVKESAGLVIKMDMGDVVDNAKTVFPEGPLNKAGEAVFDQDSASCVRDEGDWACDFTVDAAMKSTEDRSVSVTFDVEDTAGNDARYVSGLSKKQTFDLLGKLDETEPDFWTSTGKLAGNYFVDIDAAKQSFTRAPARINLEPNNNAEVVSLELIRDCQLKSSAKDSDEDSSSEGPEVVRSLIYGSTSKSPTLVMEFAPFDGLEVFNVADKKEFPGAEVTYICPLKIFSKIGQKATTIPEIEEAEVVVKFAFSQLGSKDANIDARLDEIKDEVWYKIPDKLRIFSEVMKWVQWGSSIIQILQSVDVLLGVFQTGSDAIKIIPILGVPLSSAACETAQAGRIAGSAVVETLQFVVQVFNCAPSVGGGTWYGIWQIGVLEFYNLWKGKFITDAVGLEGYNPGKSLRDNIWISSIGLCVPGIFDNLEKYRQTRCMEMKCIQENVPAGTSTIDACKRVGDFLACKHFWGELVAMLLPLEFFKNLKDLIKNIITNPLGAIRLAFVISCSTSCAAGSGKVTNLCDNLAAGFAMLDIINAVVGMVQQYEAVSYDVCAEFQEDIF